MRAASQGLDNPGAAGAAGEVTAGGAARVLLVDDNIELRRGFSRMLRRASCVVTEASNGRDALASLAAEDFELVVSDVRMPDMDGIELLKLVHERDADLPVLLVSGSPDLDSALKAVEYGAIEYLPKPVNLDKFTASVARALEFRRQRVRAKDAIRAQSAQSGARLRKTHLPSDYGDLRGALLGGCYRIGEVLGSGGMGTVYAAEREDLGHMAVAIKVLHAALSGDPDVLRRFEREAHTVAALAHPNIVRIIDFQMPVEEPAFLVMERLRGLTLGEAVRYGRRFSLAEVARMAIQVLSALEATHGAQVIHRDLKPDNVFLTSVPSLTDMVKLLDFGVAKLMGASRDEKLTQTGSVMGTPAYMAPEQARGASVDARSDLYSVGCLMFEALTGKPPFSADNYNALIFVIQDSVPVPLSSIRPDVDPVFAAVLEKAMARDPAQRFQSARAMADAIAYFAMPP